MRRIHKPLEKTFGNHILNGPVADPGRRKADHLISRPFKGLPDRTGAFAYRGPAWSKTGLTSEPEPEIDVIV